MAFFSLPPLFFFSILLTITSLKNLARIDGQCLDDQKTLLLELKEELVFDSSYSLKLVHWNQTEDCCRWNGVECDGAGHVISLQLDKESISGGIDDSSSSLFRLRYLEKLNLANNDFNKAQIPSGIHLLTYLTHLNLSNADFGGKIPVEVSLLRRLVSLDISMSYYWGSQPLKLEHPSLKMITQNLTRLEEFYLDGIDISAAGTEWCQAVSSSSLHLRILSMRNCNLSGPLDPSLLQLQSLSVLHLDWNNLSTALPDFFANFSSLTTLSLHDCSLRGSFPKMVLQVPTLQELDLSYNTLLSGTIHQVPLSRALRSIRMPGCSFAGPVPSSLSNLTELIDLDLSSNFLTGVIPSFSNSKKLTHIDLSSNSLTGSLSNSHFEGLSNLAFLVLMRNSFNGSIPHSLFGLPSLQVLDLSGNQFSGRIIEFSIMNISNMLYLDLDYNSLSGSIPMFLFRLPLLGNLILSNNQFSGQVNEFPIVNFSQMRGLDLSGNRLEGPIPDSFFRLGSLVSLSLSNNLFNGTFHLEKIWRLEYVDLSYNNLSIDGTNTDSSSYGLLPLHELGLASCNLSKFPDFLKHLSLRDLDLSNNQIAGNIPSWIWEIGNGTLSRLNLSSNLLVDLQKPYRFPASLVILDLHSNKLQGELPPLPGSAVYVDYSNNYFDKSIPNDGNLFIPGLVFLSLANNSLSGSIPNFICNSTNLQVLDLSFNNLSGSIPPCLLANIEGLQVLNHGRYNIENGLQVLNLGRNKISGRIPDKFSPNCSLQTLDLSNNNLVGNVPLSLANCNSLQVMNVGTNLIDDVFPCMLPSSLRVLVLRSNRFHGEIRCNKSWPNLQIIDIASNNLTGYLNPLSFSGWKLMMQDSAVGNLRRSNLGVGGNNISYYYRDEVMLTIKGLHLKLVKIWQEFTSIDFSCNNFKGDIPNAIGELNALYLLNLSHNSLTGPIPESFGKLRQLGSLDLSVNQLTGEIPKEIAGLTFLQVMNLSHNKLVGKIPVGSQIQTFPADSFQGNAALCGLPLNISCTNTDSDSNSPPPKLGNEETEIEWDYVFAALEYVVGLGSIVWVLLCCRSFRDKYFDKVEDVFEKIFHRRQQRRKRRRGATRVVRNQVTRQQ
ncbi:hypothetical protein C2S52_019355 [Perilla frutescens var. hirtella]|nr:hypothetical protein C2S52_019355 [Perilla frutescens var. hirtella]